MTTATDERDFSVEGYMVYHRDSSAVPEAHGDGWYFQPEHWGEGEPFSAAYPTREAALDAAYAWKQADEEGHPLD